MLAVFDNVRGVGSFCGQISAILSIVDLRIILLHEDELGYIFGTARARFRPSQSQNSLKVVKFES